MTGQLDAILAAADPARCPLDTVTAITRRWSNYGGMGNDRSAADYTDEGCRILADHAFRDVAELLARLDQARRIATTLEGENAELHRRATIATRYLRHDGALPEVVEQMLRGDW